MPTVAEKSVYEQSIYNAARAGTTNPGLPDLLAELLVAQAKHESGNFDSRAFIQGFNAFGYSYVPGAVWQTGEPGLIADNGQPVAKYKSVADSTREIVDWIYRRVKEGKFPRDLSTITTPEQYAKLLKDAGYYGDTVSNYAGGLRRFFGGSSSWVGILLLVGAGYAFWKFIINKGK